MRINKYISETGVCSRREADKWVTEGRVTINGQLAELGSQAVEDDDVRVDGEAIGKKRKVVYIALNKPVGITCTSEPHVKGNIVDFIGYPERIFPIGRLDKDSEGLILLTNDGDIVNEILRVENHHEKEYIVTVDKPITDSFIEGMSASVPILGTVTLPCKVEKVGARTFRITLTQGLNRQIRRMCTHFDYRVNKLQRVRIINIQLDGLRSGQWRKLNEEEVQGLVPGYLSDRPLEG
ncbi:MAG: 23S rRNA pseudouridine(2604) synthase RluF [Gorillibacterium sp.]|nr:23S rRNA pseudouridine(2604) synthase RluF [Gorillibacterium sp.]